MLHSWRVLAERRAQLRQAYGDVPLTAHQELAELGLAPGSLTITRGFSNSSVGEAVLFSCIAEVWGKDIADSVRDFLIEYSRNCFQHANATTVSIEFVERGIIVRDDGQRFDLHTLARPACQHGGGMAYRVLLSTLRIAAMSTSTNSLNENVLHIPLVIDTEGLLAHNPCALAISREHLRLNSIDFSSFATCDRIYVVAPDFLTFSDGPWCAHALEAAMKHHPSVILVVPRASPAVLEHFRQTFPTIEILSW